MEDLEMMKISNDELKKFYSGKKVLITGHTGFKGSYLTVLLGLLGAEVFGYSLPSAADPPLFDIIYGRGKNARTETELSVQLPDGKISGIQIAESRIGDIRDFEGFKTYYDRVRPDVLIHLAAQPLVREGYRIPRETYETNVMGTVNILEAVRLDPCCRSFLNVTTDKVYQNNELSDHAFTEDEKLDGFDPYSNSKSCSELVTHSFAASFLKDAGVAVSTARAGNVIGGGDFSKDRIIPDCVRALMEKRDIIVRNPYSIRPYQHVLEPLLVYITIAMKQAQDPSFAGWYNVGPDENDCITTGELCTLFTNAAGNAVSWKAAEGEKGPHEASFLKLDSTKLKRTFSWEPQWNIERAVKETVSWTKAWFKGTEQANEEMLRSMDAFLNNI